MCFDLSFFTVFFLSIKMSEKSVSTSCSVTPIENSESRSIVGRNKKQRIGLKKEERTANVCRARLLFGIALHTVHNYVAKCISFSI
jgi:hypothetical protein